MNAAPESTDFEPTVTAIATGLGSMPGSDALEATEVVAGELNDLPFLPELPSRGPGGDLVGRTGSLIAGVASDLSIEPVPTGWRFSGAPTRSMRQARSWLDEDLDRAEERFGSSDGSFKIQLAGPWTLAASIETAGAQRGISDSGLVAELGEALAIAAQEHVAEVKRRLPGRRIVLQIDEPLATAVSRGQLRTASGFGRYEPVGDHEMAIPWRQLVSSSGGDSHVLHSCGVFPFQPVTLAEFDGVSLDLLRIGAAKQEQLDLDLGNRVEAGTVLYAGVVPSLVSARHSPEQIADQGWHVLDSLWRRTGLGRKRLSDVVVTPTCGLAGANWPQARRALAASLEIARRLNDD